MPEYRNYEIADFLLDDTFLEWINNKQPQGDFWESFVKVYPEKAEIFSQAREVALSLSISPVRELSDSEIESIAEKLRYTIQPPAGETRMWSFYKSGWFKIAAVLVLLFTIGTCIYLYSLRRSFSPQEYQSAGRKKDKKSHPGIVKLPDGSYAILKPGSKLDFPATFTKGRREVFLSGEAFFEVKKDASQPFIVYTAEMVTKVLGTSFTVRAIGDKKDYAVTVNTGKVQVFPVKDADNQRIESKSLTDAGDNGILIVPNQQVTFNPESQQLIKKRLAEPSALSKEVSMVAFNFVETPFSKVITALSEAYGVKMNYNEKELANCPLTASLGDQPLFEKLALICAAVEAEYKITDGEIIIHGKGCETYR